MELNAAAGSSGLTRDAAWGRLRGALVGILFGAGWAVYGAGGLPQSGRWACWAATAIIVAVLIRAAWRLRADSRSLPKAGAEARAAGRRARIGFIAVLIAEVVLLNVAVALLSGPGQRIYWVPAIALVVGVHFLPLAWLFRMKAFWACGVAMTAGALLAAFAISQAPMFAGLIVVANSLVNAAILWLTAGSGLASLHSRIDATS
jgi:hypothetical protein